MTSFEGVGTDLRFGVRQLVRRPGFAAVALVTLALGIGAPTAMFSVVHAVLLKPLPYPEPDRLVQFRMESTSPSGPVSFDAVPASTALEWAADSQALSGLALFNDRAMTLTTAEGPFRLTGVSATPNLFAVLGVRPIAGTTFDPASRDLREIVLSDAMWRRHFSADRTIVGSLVTMDGESYRVMGVMPDAFRFPSAEAAFWVPQVLTSGGTRGMLLPAIARLRPTANVAAVAEEGKQRLIDTRDTRFATTLVVQTLQEQMTGGVRRLLWVLLGAVGFVTVIATTNLALLLLVRGAGRERELAIRAALGAGRGRLIRQLFIEGVTLGSLGGVAGVGFAQGALALVVSLAPAATPRLQEASLDGQVLLFAVLLTGLSSVIFGFISAARTLSGAPMRAIAGRRRLGALASAELAFTMVLLVGAGLLLRSFVGLVTIDPGFDAGSAVAFRVNLPASRYPTPDARLAFDERLLLEVKRLQGVTAAGLTTTLPTRQPTGRFGYSSSPEILSASDPFSMPVIDVHMVSDGFAEAMGLRLIAGRSFTAGDRAGADPVIVISDQFARQQFADRPAVGQTLYSETGNRRVVGVVADVRPAELGAVSKPDAYIPLRQEYDVLEWFTSTTVVVRATDVAATVAAIRPMVLALDPQSPPFSVRTLESDVADVVAAPRFSATVLSLFALVAFVMAFVGVYGVMAYSTGLRTREIGIRMAVGATRAQVLGLMLKDGVRVVALGLGAGLVAAMLLARTLTGLLHEVAPADALTLVSVGALLSLAGFVATLLPARRAAQGDAVHSLRAD